MRSILNHVLKDPNQVHYFNVSDWEMCMRQAGASKMLGRLHYLLQQEGLLEYIPPRALHHFHSADVKTQCQHREIYFEVNQIIECLAKAGITPIFLKGAAYVLSNVAYQGRTCNDIDILVPKHQLKKAEEQLGTMGWIGESISHYDAMYYRKWMHELPPMMHLERRTVLDVHHHLQPETVKRSFNISCAIASAQIQHIKYQSQIIESKTLALSDMILHSACHLFGEGELDKGLRDLSDIKLLLEAFELQFKAQSTTLLTTRADQLNLTPQLALAIHYIDKLFKHSLNLSAYNMKVAPKSLSNKLSTKILHWCYDNAFVPHHNSSRTIQFRIAALLIFIRSHYLRMPLRLLLPHLTIKSWHGLKTYFMLK